MDDIVPSFPLLHLPNNALVRVLRRMQHIDLLGLSLLSEKAKAVVKSLDVKAKEFFVDFDTTVQLCAHINGESSIFMKFFVDDFQNSHRGDSLPEMRLLKTDMVDITTCDFTNGIRVESTKWNVPGLKVRDWIVHIFSIFHHTRIEKLSVLDGFGFFETEFILKTVNGLNIKQLCIHSSLVPNQALENVLTGSLRVKEIMMFRSDNDTALFHKVLIQYLDLIAFNFPLKLNDLLTINSKSVKLWHSTLTTKYLNGFLKHWINGSNPRLRYLVIQSIVDFEIVMPIEKETLLNGIAYHEVPLDTEREFKKIGEHPVKIVKLHGGIDIRRNDGTKATITFKTHARLNTFEMFI